MALLVMRRLSLVWRFALPPQFPASDQNSAHDNNVEIWMIGSCLSIRGKSPVVHRQVPTWDQDLKTEQVRVVRSKRLVSSFCVHIDYGW